MVGEATAHVQGESLKAAASLSDVAFSTPRSPRRGALAVMLFLRHILAGICVASIACMESGCGNQPILVPRADIVRQGGILGAIGVELPQACLIHHHHKFTESGIITGGPPTVPDTILIGADGSTQQLTREQCAQENVKSQSAEEEAYQQSVASAQRAAQMEQQKHDAFVAQVVRDEAARGYKNVTVKDLYLDSKAYAASETKVSVSGFYKSYGRHKERLYNSYNELMMTAFQPGVEALSIGLLTDDGNRTLREYLLRCVAGCGVTVLGHVGQCVENNVFGATSHDVCLVAEGMRAP
jgi:hypothetical protein